MVVMVLVLDLSGKSMKTPPLSRTQQSLAPLANAPKKEDKKGDLKGVRVAPARRQLDFGDEPKRLKISFISDARVFK